MPEKESGSENYEISPDQRARLAELLEQLEYLSKNLKKDGEMGKIHSAIEEEKNKPESDPAVIQRLATNLSLAYSGYFSELDPMLKTLDLPNSVAEHFQANKLELKNLAQDLQTAIDSLASKDPKASMSKTTADILNTVMQLKSVLK